MLSFESPVQNLGVNANTQGVVSFLYNDYLAHKVNGFINHRQNTTLDQRIYFSFQFTLEGKPHSTTRQGSEHNIRINVQCHGAEVTQISICGNIRNEIIIVNGNEIQGSHSR